MIACRYGLGMHDDFYTTLAQVLPVLLLAFIWDSAYLERLRGQERRTRGQDPRAVRFWTNSRVRPFTLFVAALVVASIAITMLQLAGFVSDSFALRAILVGTLLFTLATLAARIYFDVLSATSSGPPDNS